MHCTQCNTHRSQTTPMGHMLRLDVSKDRFGPSQFRNGLPNQEHPINGQKST